MHHIDQHDIFRTETAGDDNLRSEPPDCVLQHVLRLLRFERVARAFQFRAISGLPPLVMIVP
jgi:hypothetical protein